MNTFESHTQKYLRERKSKNKADHGQLGDIPLFDKVDWFEVAVIVAVIIIFGAVALMIK